MISELISALLAVTISVTTIHEIPKPTITLQVRQVDARRESKVNQTRNTTIGESSAQDEKAQIIQEIHKVFREKASEAESVFRCESNLRVNAASPTGDFGIGQINLKAHWNQIRGKTREDKITNLLDLTYNISFAYSLYTRQLWQPWASSKHCWNT